MEGALEGDGINDPKASNMRATAMILALGFAVVAIFYWLIPAGSLPEFFPGFEAGSTRFHTKHGIAAAVAAILMYAAGRYLGRSRA
jgi:hypothetical protein